MPKREVASILSGGSSPKAIFEKVREGFVVRWFLGKIISECHKTNDLPKRSTAGEFVHYFGIIVSLVSVFYRLNKLGVRPIS